MGMFDFLLDMGNYEDRKVDRFEQGEVKVDTCRVSDGRQPFETAVMHPDYEGTSEWTVVEAYDTKEEAQVGHDKWVKILTEGPLPPELRDCQNAEVSQMLSGDSLIYKKKAKKEVNS